MADDETKPATRRGRPAGKRGTFTFRVTAELRARLERAAAAAERPVSEEIERRLDLSFSGADLLLAQFGDRETLRLVQAVSLLARAVENDTGKIWNDDPETKGRLAAALSRFFQIYFYEHNEADSKKYLNFDDKAGILGQLGRGHPAAETVASILGLRSKAREEMDAFLATPEGQAAWERARLAVEANKTDAKSRD